MHGMGERHQQKQMNAACILLLVLFRKLSLYCRSATGPVVEPDLDKDEEDLVLCDPEEMDLLGEIFDTLSTRSSHDRGLLYGTRSLDLFGPDSHDYITKVRK